MNTVLGHRYKVETLYPGTESGTGTSLHTILASAQEVMNLVKLMVMVRIKSKTKRRSETKQNVTRLKEIITKQGNKYKGTPKRTNSQVRKASST